MAWSNTLAHKPPAPPVRELGGVELPSKDTLDYVKTAIELGLLLLALPWIMYRLLTNPAALVKSVGRRHEV